MLSKILLLIVFFFSFSLQAETDEDRYGWRIPYTPLHVGGYFSLKYDEKEQNDLQFDDIAILFYGTYAHYRLLGEIESSDVSFSDGQEAEDVLSGNTNIHIERLQLEHEFSDSDTIRLGKFNSDIGYWNQTPINVLDDTTSAPNILKHVFPKLTTGILYVHNYHDGEESLSMTFQHNHDLDKYYNNILIDRHYGINFKSYQDLFSWSLSSGYFRKLDKSDAYYVGIGFDRESAAWSFQGELFSKKETNKDIPYDGYLQATWHIRNHHDIVLRGEAYRDDALDVREQISLLGYTYRPWTSVALKGEYLNHSKLPLSRFIFSFSVIF